MAINIRYGQDGDLLQMAHAAGAGQAHQRRLAQEMQIANNIRQYYAQQDANRLKSQELQQAAQARTYSQRPGANRVGGATTQMVRAQTPSQQAQQPQGDPYSNLNLTPMQQDALKAAMESGDRELSRQIINQAMSGGGRTGGGSAFIHSGNEGFSYEGGQVRGARTVTDAAGRRVVQEIPESEIQQRGGFVGPGVQPQQVDPATQRKMQIVQSFGADLPPDIQQGFITLANDPSVDANTLTLRIQQEADNYRQTLSPSEQAVDRRFQEGQRVKELTAHRDELANERSRYEFEEREALKNGDQATAARIRNQFINPLNARINEINESIYANPNNGPAIESQRGVRQPAGSDLAVDPAHAPGMDPDVATLHSIFQSINSE